MLNLKATKQIENIHVSISLLVGVTGGDFKTKDPPTIPLSEAVRMWRNTKGQASHF